MKRTPETRGLTLIELMAAALVVSLMALGVARLTHFSARRAVRDDLQALASQKCLNLLAEVRRSNHDLLDALDETESVKNLMLSLGGTSGHEGAPSFNKGGKLYRRINVKKVPGIAGARDVTVRVFLTATNELLATASDRLETRTGKRNSIQYFSQIEWAPAFVPAFYQYRRLNYTGIVKCTTNDVYDYIHYPLNKYAKNMSDRAGDYWYIRSTLAYGRDPYYRQRRVDASNSYVYLSGRDSGAPDGPWLQPGQSLANQYQWTPATEQNHAVRYPDELAWDSRLSAGGQGRDTSVRISLERLIAGLDRNLMLLNRMGGILPAPAMRNYSDAAREPLTWPDQRAVTHPENLESAAGGGVRLRVYGYAMRPDQHPESEMISTITVRVPRVSGLPGAGTAVVRRLQGDGAAGYSWVAAAPGTDYTESVTGSEYVLRLNNTPVRCPQAADGTGLPAAKRVDGLEYIPAVVGTPGSPFAFGEGQRDLQDPGGTAKNTARWTIAFPAGTFGDGQRTIETRLGTSTATGVYNNKPENLSKTYVWVGAAVPWTERYQFVGDPRHMPYQDVKAAHGYNRYFLELPPGDYEGFTETHTGWDNVTEVPAGVPTAVKVNVDVPRYMEMWREAVLNSGSVLSDGLACGDGHSFGYLSHGGEVSGQYYNPLSIVEKPWNPNSSASVQVNERSGPARPAGSGRTNFAHAYQRVIARSDGSWVSIPWLGELVPDSEYAAWRTDGNLPTGPTGYMRALTSVYSSTFGYSAPLDFVKQIGPGGLGLLLNANTAGSGGAHVGQHYVPNFDGAGSLQPPALRVPVSGEEFSRAMNLTPTMYGLVHMTVDAAAASAPAGYDGADYAGKRLRLEPEPLWEDASGRPVAAVFRLTDPMNPSRAGVVAVNGGLYSNVNDTFDYTMYSLQVSHTMARALWGYLRMGEPSVAAPARAAMVPRVVVTSPVDGEVFENPSTIRMEWTIDFVRWDEKPYTSAYPAPFIPGTSVGAIPFRGYKLGTTYYGAYAGDCVQGVHANGQETYLYPGWQPAYARTSPFDFPVSTVPEGTYDLCVDVYPLGTSHKAYHGVQVYIKR